MKYKYSATTKPGMSDPYWYEWSIGELYLLKMLYDDSDIDSVAFQSNISLGLDDVVVYYKNGDIKCIQVKHSRADDTLTFGNIVSAGEDGGTSILKELAESWYAEKVNYKEIVPQIITNRKIGKKESTRKTTKDKRPALNSFWESLKEQLQNEDVELKSIFFEGYDKAWNEWLEQLSVIPEEKDKIKFLRLLEIETEQPNLEEIEYMLIDEIAKIFGVNHEIANSLFVKLDQKMRYWTSSQRKVEKVKPEDVWDAMATETPKRSYNHDLCPCEPFFESRLEVIGKIEEELKNGKEPIIFLKGLPGIGKTNIISKLSNKRDSLIKLRYYAYEPVQPDKEYLPVDVSERVNKDVFWNELFCQLRALLKGNLQKYKVPLQNDFMTLEDMKKKFFEIASKYAFDEEITFVVAIDGIDHAARASGGKETFLNTLPNPIFIPKNVKLLIAGQPEEGYEEYPRWIREENENVKKYDVPGIQNEDILMLVSSKISKERKKEYKSITNVIDMIAKGNTLSAIFAVHEATMCTNAMELEKRLTERKLHVNIEEYYTNIWENAVRRLNFHGFVDYKIAGILSLFNEKIDGKVLVKIFSKENISQRSWEDILAALKPLIIEERGKYRLIHNDVKVFLSRNIGQGDRVKYISDVIASYYMDAEFKTKAYYYDICKFLKMAGRIKEIVTMFSPKFVIEAYVNGVSLNNLANQANEILKDLLSESKLDWNKFINLSTAWCTIEKIEHTELEIEDYSFINTNKNIPYSEFECIVTEVQNWNAELIADVLDEIYFLYEVNSKRAEEMFLRWFSELNILVIWKLLSDKGMLDERFEREVSPLTETAKRIAKKLGILICRFQKYEMLEEGMEDKQFFKFFCHVGTEFFKEAVLLNSGEVLKGSLDTNYIVNTYDLIECCIQCIKQRRYKDLGIIEESYSKIIVESNISKLLILFMRIVSGNIELQDKFERKKILDEMMEIELPELSYEYTSVCYCIYAVVIGCLNASVDNSINAHHVLELYMKKHRHDNKGYYGKMFNLMCTLGNWIFQLRKNKTIVFDKDCVISLIEGIFISKHNLLGEDYTLRKYYSEILISIIVCMEKVEPELKVSLQVSLERVFECYPVDRKMEAGWYFYRDKKDKIQEWVKYWINDNGGIWDQEIGERNRMAYDFIRLAHEYQLYDYLQLDEFEEKIKWSVIGYASRKDYSFTNILDWYNSLSMIDNSSAISFVHEIKLLSDKVEEMGDNRLFYEINCRVYSEVFSQQLEQTKKIISKDKYFEELIRNPNYIVEGLIGILENNIFSEEQLLKLWAFGIGMLDWRNDSNHSAIAGLRHAICKNAEKNNVDVNKEKLGEIGRAELQCYNDPVRFWIPDRWCEEREETIASEEQALEVIEQYLLDEKGDIKELDIIDSIKYLANKETDFEFSDYYRRVYHKKISENNTYTNTVIQYCIENLPPASSDELIRERLLSGLNGEIEYFYPCSELEKVCRWKIPSCGKEYAIYGLKQYLDMQNNWLNSGGHISVLTKAHEMSEDIKKCKEFIDIESVDSWENLFVRMLLLEIMSTDTDRVATALRGLYQLIKLSPKLLGIVDSYWEQFHIEVQEWYLMILELLLDDGIAIYDIRQILLSHKNTKDFIVSLYLRLLLEKINLDTGNEEELPDLEEQNFFEVIQDSGNRKMIKYNNESRTVSCTSYVMSIIRNLNYMTQDGGDGLEERILEYIFKAQDLESPLFRIEENPQLEICVFKECVALHDIVYKDYYHGRWIFETTSLLQCILSASEPYILFNSFPKYPHNNGKFICENKNKFLEHADKEKIIREILEYGIDENEERILGGAIVEYDGEKEIDGFLLSYLDFPNVNQEVAQNAGHMNGRNILSDSVAFFESPNPNITLINGGITRFLQTQKICDISNTALHSFGWRMIVDRGIFVVNEENEKVIRLEIFNGERDMGNRYHCLQPTMQRWIIKNSEYERIQGIYKDFKMKTTVFVEISRVR